MKHSIWIVLILAAIVSVLSWRRPQHEGSCADCGTLFIAAVSEPPTIMPALVQETVGRDISDQIYEKLANLSPGKPPIDQNAYVPALAQQWTRVDSLTWRFHLRPGARWHDGQSVTSDDVKFSFEVFSDTLLGSPSSYALAGRVQVVPEDSATFLVRFLEAYPEQLYDATYHVRVIPKHVWGGIPRDQWPADTAMSHLIGSGPYRVDSWARGNMLRIVADPGYPHRPGFRQALWRFTADPDAALNLALSEKYYALETVGTPARAQRVAPDTAFTLMPYPSAAYGFLGFNLGARPSQGAQSVLADRATRRALALAIDRPTLARGIFGPQAKAPPGPMSQLLWIWDDSIVQPTYDPEQAGRMLAGAGWTRGTADGVLRRRGQPLSFDILVPNTSTARRQLAVALQEQWRRIGVRVTITTVDFPVFQERLAKGKFDAYMGAYLDEPSPRGLKEQWTRAGWGALNYGRYASRSFDSLVAAASNAADVRNARRLWREAMDTLNADVPALFLYTPAQVAAIPKRYRKVSIDPYSWLHTLPEWQSAK